MTTAVIVQARIGSSRLPGKVLQPLGSRSALLRCLDRCRQITQADLVVCAVPDTRADDEVAEEATDVGYIVIRGPEDDVLHRYALAARECEADTIIRITSDCPFIDPVIVDQTVMLYRKSVADYTSNSMPPLFPHGLDCEVFSAQRLLEADEKATQPYEREHVTPWIRRNPRLTQSCLLGPGGGIEKLRWTLDRPEDLAFCQAVYETLGEEAATILAADLARFCLQNPDIVAINEDYVDLVRLKNPQRSAIVSNQVDFDIAAG